MLAEQNDVFVSSQGALGWVRECGSAFAAMEMEMRIGASRRLCAPVNNEDMITLRRCFLRTKVLDEGHPQCSSTASGPADWPRRDKQTTSAFAMRTLLLFGSLTQYSLKLKFSRCLEALIVYARPKVTMGQ